MRCAPLLAVVLACGLAAEDAAPIASPAADAPAADAPLPTIQPPATPPPPALAAIPASALPDRLRRLDKLDEASRTALLHELVYERQQTYEVLIDRLLHGNPTTRCHAAFLLGCYRMEHAAPHLARVIWLTDDTSERLVLEEGEWQKKPTDVWFWNRYPAAEALVAIGQPSVPYLVEVLGDEDDLQIRRLAVATLLKIVPDRAGALVGDAADAESSQKRRGRLMAAVTMFP